LTDGEASVAIKEAAGRTVTSLVGLTLAYNTLDSNKDPTKGFFAELKPEVAGAGGDSKFLRVVGSARYYHPITDDFIGMLKVQGGQMAAFGGNKLRVLDHFYMGPDLVRGFAPSGIGPRDRNGESGANALGGTTYFGATAEITFPIFGIPREIGLKGAVFADAGTLFGYKGKKWVDLNKDGVQQCPANSAYTECLSVRDDKGIRSSVGAGLLWASPLGPIRFDYAYAISRAKNGTLGGGDRLQAFRFSGGANF
jgi:outer membrane protein insertion porin family